MEPVVQLSCYVGHVPFRGLPFQVGGLKHFSVLELICNSELA